ncbi:MAG: peptidoglycan-binding domain-containing protein [Pseudomonadota bacterium]
MANRTNVLISSLAALTMLAGPASADLKDLLIGGAIGAVVVDQLHKNNDKKRAKATRSGSSAAYSAPQLNDQYSERERVQIQESLNALGFYVGDVDGVLGSNSRRGIAQYQASIGDASTGQLSGGQYASLTNSASGQVMVAPNRGLRSDEITMLQQGLTQLGYYAGDINGVAGPGTNGALTAFLVNQRVEAQSVNPVQALVLVADEANMQIPQYLIAESGYTHLDNQAT